MSIEPSVPGAAFSRRAPVHPPAVIKGEDIKAILYLGIKGEVSLPAPDKTIDILA